jgi:DNA-binding transcriptional LysR family regulator
MEYNLSSFRKNKTAAMVTFEGMRVFVKVAEAGSLSGAARLLGLTPSAISRQISALEDQLGAQLFNRTTRKIALTDVGRGYLERCRRILADVEEATEAVTSLNATPRGPLRVNMPAVFGRLHIAPALGAFMRQYPDITLDVEMTDQFIDPLAEAVDVLVRIAELKDSSLIARKLANSQRVIVGSPAYWAERGVPKEPRDLTRHDCLLYSYLAAGEHWRLTGADGVEQAIHVTGRMRVNNVSTIRCAALDGLGVAMLPTWFVGEDLRAGRLQAVLGDYDAPAPPIYAMYPPSRHLSPKVRAFVDFLSGLFSPVPRWEAGAPLAPRTPDASAA